MKYRDLRDFIRQLEAEGELRRIGLAVDPHLEMTEICDRTLKAEGPALLFENVKGSSVPVLANLFGTPKRVAMGMGEESVDALREVGKLLSFLNPSRQLLAMHWIVRPSPRLFSRLRLADSTAIKLSSTQVILACGLSCPALTDSTPFPQPRSTMCRSSGSCGICLSIKRAPRSRLSPE